jgi:hypothetical protein
MKIGFIIIIVIVVMWLAAAVMLWPSFKQGMDLRYTVRLTGGPSTTAAQLVAALQVTGAPPMTFMVKDVSSGAAIIGAMGSGSLVINNMNGALTGGTVSVTDTSVTSAGVSSTVLTEAQNYPIMLA